MWLNLYGCQAVQRAQNRAKNAKLPKDMQHSVHISQILDRLSVKLKHTSLPETLNLELKTPASLPQPPRHTSL